MTVPDSLTDVPHHRKGTEMTEEDYRRELAAILSVDMKEYSRLMSLDETGTHQLTRAAISNLKNEISDARGSIVTLAGDGIIAKFSSIFDALKVAINFQAQMQNDPMMSYDDELVQFRIGLNVADIIIDSDQVHGDGVNIAKRIESIADPGGIFISRSAYEHIAGLNKYKTEYLGDRQLKNISRKIGIYRLLHEKLALLHKPTQRASDVPLPVVSKPSIAVLPFMDMSNSQDQGFLCDGITEDIISNLGRFRELFVISRNTSFQLKGLSLSPAEIGQRLGIKYVLEGSVRRSENKLRIVANLTECSSNKHVWSDTFNVELRDLFELQDQITGIIASRLAQSVHEEERNIVRSRETNDLEAYGFVLHAQESFFKYTKEGNNTARLLYQRALERDPEYARAYAALSRTHIYDWRYMWTETPEKSFDEAFECARQAVSLDDRDARGYAELGFVYLWSKETAKANKMYKKALELNPNDSDVMAEYADALQYEGRFEECEKLLKEAMRLNPFYPDWYPWYLADAYYAMERYEDAIASIHLMNDTTEGERLLAASHAMLGDERSAKFYAKQILKKHPNFSVTRWTSIQPDADDRVRERFATGLRRAGLPD